MKNSLERLRKTETKLAIPLAFMTLLSAAACERTKSGKDGKNAARVWEQFDQAVKEQDPQKIEQSSWDLLELALSAPNTNEASDLFYNAGAGFVSSGDTLKGLGPAEMSFKLARGTDIGEAGRLYAELLKHRALKDGNPLLLKRAIAVLHMSGWSDQEQQKFVAEFLKKYPNCPADRFKVSNEAELEKKIEQEIFFAKKHFEDRVKERQGKERERSSWKGKIK